MTTSDDAPKDGSGGAPAPKKGPEPGSSGWKGPTNWVVADEKSYGNMSEKHWSKTRGSRNSEAIDYYRERSQAPGVEAGGEARNFYCMECDGVIPWDDFEGDACPHCGASLEGSARRYFNWVEIDRTPTTDRTAMALAAAIVVGALALLGLAAWLILR